MKRGGILHPEISHLIASTGHTDYFTICDQRFPIDKDQHRIDLALTHNSPTVLDVLRLVEADFIVDRILIAEEGELVSPKYAAELRDLWPAIRIEAVPHVKFKRLSAQGRATIRTGDTTPYANVLVISG